MKFSKASKRVPGEATIKVDSTGWRITLRIVLSASVSEGKVILNWGVQEGILSSIRFNVIFLTTQMEQRKCS